MKNQRRDCCICISVNNMTFATNGFRTYTRINFIVLHFSKKAIQLAICENAFQHATTKK